MFYYTYSATNSKPLKRFRTDINLFQKFSFVSRKLLQGFRRKLTKPSKKFRIRFTSLNFFRSRTRAPRDDQKDVPPRPVTCCPVPQFFCLILPVIISSVSLFSKNCLIVALAKFYLMNLFSNFRCY